MSASMRGGYNWLWWMEKAPPGASAEFLFMLALLESPTDCLSDALELRVLPRLIFALLIGDEITPQMTQLDVRSYGTLV